MPGVVANDEGIVALEVPRTIRAPRPIGGGDEMRWRPTSGFDIGTAERTHQVFAIVERRVSGNGEVTVLNDEPGAGEFIRQLPVEPGDRHHRLVVAPHRVAIAARGQHGHRSHEARLREEASRGVDHRKETTHGCWVVSSAGRETSDFISRAMGERTGDCELDRARPVAAYMPRRHPATRDAVTV